MPRSAAIPKVTWHRASRRAVIRLAGKDHYLGPWSDGLGQPPLAVRELADRLVAVWLAAGRCLPPGTTVVPVSPAGAPGRVDVRCAQESAGPGPAGALPGPAEPPDDQPLTITELCVRFVRWGDEYYRHPDGTPTGEMVGVREALKPLRALYGSASAPAFRAGDLRALQAHLTREGRLCRTTINARVDRVKRLFKWGVSHDLVPVEVHTALSTVPGLKAGRTAAREPEPVGPVAQDVVEKTLPHLTDQVRAMVMIQLYSGCRGGEVCCLRPCDLDTRGPVWEYRPRAHKGSWRGKERVIHLGPRAQAVLQPWLPAACPVCQAVGRRGELGWRGTTCGPCADALDSAGIEGPWPPARVPDAWLTRAVFSPREAVTRCLAARRARRKTAVQPSQADRSKKGARKRAPGEMYTTRSYTRAISRACAAAGVEPWSSHQLRHATGTLIRARYGLEASRVVLGHDKVETTLVYSERDAARAAQIIAEVG